MSTMLPDLRPIMLADINAARARIAGTVLRTPLVRLDLGAGLPDIWLKLENLQPTNSYKIRGAANAVALLSDADRARGVWTISAGNAGQGVAYAARQAGVPCTVLAIDNAPATKLNRMRALGATLVMVPFDTALQAMAAHAYAGMDGTFIHPFDNHDFIAGHATIGLEILEDAPDTQAVIAGIGGGGLVVGIGSALKAINPAIQVFTAEPETAAPTALSFAEGGPREFAAFQPSFIDGAGGRHVFPRMWDRMRGVVDGGMVVTLDQTRAALRLMAEKARIVSEGAGALSLAAALTGKAGKGPIVAIVSGGNIDLAKFVELIG